MSRRKAPPRELPERMPTAAELAADPELLHTARCVVCGDADPLCVVRAAYGWPPDCERLPPVGN